MARRLSILAAVILLLFVVIAGQSANLQFFRAKSLDASPLNPRNNVATNDQLRGEIVSSNGAILAESVPTGNARDPYRRIYPLGALTSGLVGFVSPFYDQWALEAQYNALLEAHNQPPQSLEQLLAPTTGADDVYLTLNTRLEKLAQTALAGRDGAVVVLDPKNGDVLAMYSNPTYDPVPLTSSEYSVAEAAWKKDTTNDAEGFPPLGELATQQTFPPGSTFKVITTSAVVRYKPSLLDKSYPLLTETALPDSNKTLSNFDLERCGGTIAEMLPPSCDTGYALVGLDLGGDLLTDMADRFGYDEIPPIDLPGTVASAFPTKSYFTVNLPELAYSAIGQENVRATPLQNALVAATIADGGVEMTPHLLSYVTGPDGNVIERYQPKVWKTPLGHAEAAQVGALMRTVVTASDGTAAGTFPASYDAAAKTGTAQTGTAAKDTDDWMIAFAPYSDPTVAIAVVLPFQVQSATGALVAGPVISCVLGGALDLQSGQAVPTACPG